MAQIRRIFFILLLTLLFTTPLFADLSDLQDAVRLNGSTFTTGQTSLPTGVATQISSETSAVSIIVCPVATSSNIFLGSSSVTSSTGLRLTPSNLTINLTNPSSLYAISDIATPSITYFILQK